MQHHETPRLITARDAARCLGITKSTVYDWIARGYLPAHRFSRTIRIRLSDLEEHIERSAINDFATAKELVAQEQLGIRTAAAMDDVDPSMSQMGAYAPSTTPSP